MCAGDDHNCPDFDLHRQQLLEELDSERRGFLKSAFAAGGAAAWAAGGTVISQAGIGPDRGRPRPASLPLPAGDGGDRPLGLIALSISND
jgi:hypothetical protein